MSEPNEKQKLFCDYYLVSFNATQAATQAGYSKKTAAALGFNLLKNPSCQQYLNSRRKALTEKLEYSQEKTLLEIARVAFQDIRKFYDQDGNLLPIAQLDDDAAAALASVEDDLLYETDDTTGEKKLVGVTKKIKRWDKTKALEMLAKYYKLYTDAPVTTVNLQDREVIFK